MSARTKRLPRSPYGPGTHVVEFHSQPLGHLPGGWVRIKGPWPESTCLSYVGQQRRTWAGTAQAECYRVVQVPTW